jgi:hypothetical protein
MGVSEARSALRRARRDQLLAIVSIASASLRIRLARGRLGVLRSVAHWKKRTRRRLRPYAAGAARLRGWLD